MLFCDHLPYAVVGGTSGSQNTYYKGHGEIQQLILPVPVTPVIYPMLSAAVRGWESSVVIVMARGGANNHPFHVSSQLDGL